ncbi:MAG: hypothetical protein DBY41_01310 [Clostridium sp.]|jgi:uncharacterized membrane protein required for colicin V production|nr:MAG: hypothetical protein DBY41_01310 [Clostridium sp.]
MGIIVDLIIIAVVLLFIFLGYKKGLTGSLIKLLSFIIAIVVAFVLYKPVANAVIENTVIDDNIRTTLRATLGVEDKTENTEENVPSTIMDNINKEIENATDEVKANVIDQTTITIVNIGSGIVIFLAVRVILVIISLFAKILTDLPVIKQVDKLGGLAYGAIEGIVIVYAVLAVISLTSVIWANNAVVTAIAKSSLGEMLYNNNIILNLLFK